MRAKLRTQTHTPNYAATFRGQCKTMQRLSRGRTNDQEAPLQQAASQQMQMPTTRAAFPASIASQLTHTLLLAVGAGDAPPSPISAPTPFSLFGRTVRQPFRATAFRKQRTPPHCCDEQGKSRRLAHPWAPWLASPSDMRARLSVIGAHIGGAGGLVAASPLRCQLGSCLPGRSRRRDCPWTNTRF